MSRRFSLTPLVRASVRAMKSRAVPRVLAAALLHGSAMPSQAQIFTKITDPANPVVSESAVASNSYSGASWVDVDADGWLDLHVSGRPLFRGLGGGAFSADTAAIVPQVLAQGQSWADVDNDGRIDCYVAGSAGILYRNLGGSFLPIVSGAIGDTLANRGFSAAFGDYDRDGLVDLVTTFFLGGLAGPSSNQLFHNEGGVSFARISGTPVTADTSTFIIPSWSDWDLDGDDDLSIGRGPITAVGPDAFFRNRLVEDGIPSFEPVTSGALALDARDGQSIAWIDYDNDGDLDAFVANFRGGAPGGRANDLYRNDAGTFVRMSAGDVGPLVEDVQPTTGSCWGDFDNDGWLDAVVCNDQFTRNKLYLNDGDGTFTKVTTGDLVTTPGYFYAIVTGDYDRDGDLDLFVSGRSGSASLWRNDSASGRSWLSVRCVGTDSNRSAIGTRLRATTTVGGQTLRQLREIQSQAGSAGTNSLAAFFGLGDAANVDSLVVEWPSGAVQTLVNVATNQEIEVTEPSSAVDAAALPGSTVTAHGASPNPFTGSTTLRFDVPRSGRVRVGVYDVRGRAVRFVAREYCPAGPWTVDWDGRSDQGAKVPAGVYFVRLEAPGIEASQKVVLLR